MKRLITLLIAFAPFGVQSQIIGPMVGYVDYMEAHIWVQHAQGGVLQLAYTVNGDSVSVLESPLLVQESGYTHTFVLQGLKPGTTYRYAVKEKHGGTEGVISTFTTEQNVLYRDQLPDLRILLGSCAYKNDSINDRPGRPYGVENRIFDQMAIQKPDITLWLGDNIYLREADWGSASGYNYRYSHCRADTGLQHLLRIGKHYAIWDDHDFGPNDANGSWYNSRIAKSAFQNFWANPSYGLPGIERGICTQFDHADIGFFLTDNRTYREPGGKDAAMLGKKQLKQLLNALESSKHNFKLVAVGGQVLNDDAIFENYAQYENERNYLLQEIEKRNIKNVIFLTGDRHHTALSMVTNEKGNVVYDLTVSPLTSKAYSPKDKNSNLVKHTTVDTQNFGIIEITGKPYARSLTMRIMNPQGKTFWTKTIEQQN